MRRRHRGAARRDVAGLVERLAVEKIRRAAGGVYSRARREYVDPFAARTVVAVADAAVSRRVRRERAVSVPHQRAYRQSVFVAE